MLVLGLAQTALAAPPSSADLSVTISDSPDPVAEGAEVTYTISVSNAGPLAASDVTLSDTVQGGANYVRGSASQGSCTGVAPLSCSEGLNTFNLSAQTAVRVSLDPAPRFTGYLSAYIESESGGAQYVTGARYQNGEFWYGTEEVFVTLNPGKWELSARTSGATIIPLPYKTVTLFGPGCIPAQGFMGVRPVCQSGLSISVGPTPGPPTGAYTVTASA